MPGGQDWELGASVSCQVEFGGFKSAAGLSASQPDGRTMAFSGIVLGTPFYD